MRDRIAAALAVAAVLGVGSLVLQRWVAETRGAAMILVAALFLVVGLAVLFAVRSRPDLRAALLGPFVAIALGTVAIGYWTGFRDDEVDEDVVVASADASEEERASGLAATGGDGTESKEERPQRDEEPKGPVNLASASFTGVDGHAASGKATVVRSPNGSRALTFTNFDVDPGPGVEVYLTRNPDDISDRVELGGLKGNVGDQQYDIPESADLGSYDTVVLYCTPFTVRMAVAELG